MGACLTKPVGDAAQKGPPPLSSPTTAAFGRKLISATSQWGAARNGSKPATPRQVSVLAHVVPQVMEAPNEEARKRAVRALQLVDVAPQPQFKSITALMKQMFDTPVAAITLIDEDLHIISHAGDWACSAGRPGSFCDWILVPETPQLLIVEDARVDARFKHNKFVMGEPYLRFYAGAPLVSSHQGGHRYGTLCVFDFRPRHFDAAKYAMLAHFAEIVVREMERELVMVLQQRKMGTARKAEDHLIRAMDSFHEGIMLLDLSSTAWSILYANDTLRRITGLHDLLLEQDGGMPEGSPTVDFWQHFSHVTAGTSGSYRAALLAMATGRDFSIQVRPSSGSEQQEVLNIRFQPADTEQLRAEMPHIGIQAWIDSAHHADDEESGGGTSAGAGAMVAAAGMGCGSCAGRTPIYYFGMVKASAALSSSGSVMGAHANSSLLGLSDTPSTSLGPATNSFLDSALELSVRLDPAKILPSFTHMRPEVLVDVQLGPLIGTGSMGRCYRGMWQGGSVAVKIIECWEEVSGVEPSPLSTLELPAQGTQAVVVEALLARSLSHPHIVTTFSHGMSSAEVHNLGRRHSQVWIVQEFCNRGALRDAIDNGSLHCGDGGPNLHALLLMAQEIAGACAYLHSHDVIHGDLTPSNVLLMSATKDQRRWTCKVCDFGLTKRAGSAQGLQSSSFGTVTYMPPELLSVGKLSKAADVYSFGIILLEMYYGQRAWLGIPPLRILAKVSDGLLPFEVPADAPRALASLMRRCLDLKPERRPAFTTVLLEVQDLIRSLSHPASSEPKTAGGAAAAEAAAAAAAAKAEEPVQQAPQQVQATTVWLHSGGRSTGASLQLSGMASPFAAASKPQAVMSPFAPLPPEPASRK